MRTRQLWSFDLDRAAQDRVTIQYDSASCERCYCGIPVRATGVHRGTGRVKEIFLGAATDLKRERSFQGAGLIDLMRAIQSV